MATKRKVPTEASLRTVLEKCVDPELGVDIIHLGLVYEVKIQDPAIEVIMSLTTPGCPLAPYFHERIRELITEAYPGTKPTVTITFSPPWSPEKMSPDIRAMFGR